MIGHRPQLGMVIAALASAIFIGALSSAYADGGGGGGDSDAPRGAAADPRYAKAVQLIAGGGYTEAIALLNQFVADKPKEADGHNMLGYATRKMGQPEASLPHYLQALRLNPKHRGAHEYIGEAYLQLGRLDKAKEHLAWLDDDCWLPCEEYSDLKEAVARYEAQRSR